MRMICLGDSITDCGRFFDEAPLGDGYVNRLSQRLLEGGFDWDVVNCGMDGFTVSRLLAYVQGGILAPGADFASVLIGINDIGLMMNTGRTPAQQEHMMERFFVDYENLLRLLRKNTSHIILMEPFVFPRPARYCLWFPYVEKMSRGISALADKYCLPYLLLHKRLNEDAQTWGIDRLTIDGIHLTSRGHEFIADALYRHLCKI